MDQTTRLLMEIQKSSTETATNVLFLRQSFDEHKRTITKTLEDHIAEDQRILREHIVPLLREKEQAAGAEKQVDKTGRRIGVAFAIIVPIISAISGFLGGKVGH